MGNRMPKSSEQKVAKKCSGKCVEGVCSFHGKCRIDHPDEEKEEEVQKKDESKETKGVMEESKGDEGLEERSKDKKLKTEIQVKTEIAEENEDKPLPEIALEEEYDSDRLEGMYVSLSESMDELQKKLNTISEISETEVTTADKNIEAKDGYGSSVSKIERGSSPINIFALIKEEEDTSGKKHGVVVLSEDIPKGKSEVQSLKCIYEPAEKPPEPSFVTFDGKRAHHGGEERAKIIEKMKKIKAVSHEVIAALFSDESSAEEISSPDKSQRSSVVSGKSSEKMSEASSVKLSGKISEKYGGKMCKKSSDKSAKLSIQVLPSVNIRGGLVVQQTLHLCIKSTGSVSNEATSQSNIGYEEVKIDQDAKSEEAISKLKRCPEDCSNLNGYCKSVNTNGDSYPSYMETNFPRPEPKKPVDEDALYMFRSFQIIDPHQYRDRTTSLTNLNQAAAVAAARESLLSSSSSEEESEISSDEAKEESETSFRGKKSPWEIGFYKTVAVQCGEGLGERTSGTEVMARSSSIAKVGEQKESVSMGQTSSEGSSSTASRQGLSLKAVESEEPVKDVAKTSAIQKKGETVSFQSSESGTSGEPSSDTTVSSTNTSEQPEKEGRVEPLKEVKSTESSSDSSYDTYSVQGASPAQKSREQRPQIGVKRPYQEEEGTEEVKKDQTDKGKSVRMGEEVKKDGDSDLEVEKADQNIQVCLGSSSSASTVSSSEDAFVSKKKRDTVAYFIKGLTGTSREQLAQLRSNPSFPRSEFSSWSKTALKTIEERNSVPEEEPPTPKNGHKKKKEKKKKKKPGEKVVETHADDDADLSDEAKAQRLKEFQRMVMGQMAPPQSNNKPSDKVVMMVREERGEDGDVSHGDRKRQLPFYRKVLGRVIESPTRRPIMSLSRSEATPADESISEGEIKCKNSLSIGEINPSKYVNEWDNFGNSGIMRLKRHPDEMIRKELGDKTLRVARQRTQYNHWVTYYLQKHHHSMWGGDSSSASSPISSKKH